MSRNGPPPNASSNTNAGGTPTARQTRAPYSQTQAYRDGPPLDFGEDSDDEEFDVDVDVSDDDLLVEARARRVVDPTVARLDASTNSAAQVRDARLVVERERERDRARRRAHIFEAKMVASKAAIAKLEVVDNALLTEDNKGNFPRNQNFLYANIFSLRDLLQRPGCKNP